MSRGIWKKERGEYPEDDSDRPLVIVSKTEYSMVVMPRIVPSTIKIHGHAGPVISTLFGHCRD